MKDISLLKSLREMKSSLESNVKVQKYLEVMSQLSACESRIKNEIKDNLIVKDDRFGFRNGWHNWTKSNSRIKPIVLDGTKINGSISNSGQVVYYSISHRKGYEVKPTATIKLEVV
jgi:hypothetical protein